MAGGKFGHKQSLPKTTMKPGDLKSPSNLYIHQKREKKKKTHNTLEIQETSPTETKSQNFLYQSHTKRNRQLKQQKKKKIKTLNREMHNYPKNLAFPWFFNRSSSATEKIRSFSANPYSHHKKIRFKTKSHRLCIEILRFWSRSLETPRKWPDREILPRRFENSKNTYEDDQKEGQKSAVIRVSRERRNKDEDIERIILWCSNGVEEITANRCVHVVRDPRALLW